jgi:hypothetical protein
MLNNDWTESSARNSLLLMMVLFLLALTVLAGV